MVADEEVVVLDQQRDAPSERQLEPDASARAHLPDQRFRDAQIADLLALALDEHRPRRIEASQGVPDAAVEFLLRRLRSAGDQAEDRAAMVGERLEVEDLRALPLQLVEQPALPRPGRPADDPPIEARRQLGERGDDGAPVLAVAALQEMDAKADLVEHRGERAAALAAAPAVDERRPAVRRVEQVALDVRGDVACDQHGAALPRRERRDLLVERADHDPLGIVERRPVDRPGQPVLGELALRACVDDGVEAAEVGERLAGADDGQRHVARRFGAAAFTS